jgi:hypothetical protein
MIDILIRIFLGLFAVCAILGGIGGLIMVFGPGGILLLGFTPAVGFVFYMVGDMILRAYEEYKEDQASID